MQTEEILTGVFGELHELLGDHREFKRETLSRLSALEKEVKDAPALRSARLAAAVCQGLAVARKRTNRVS